MGNSNKRTPLKFTLSAFKRAFTSCGRAGSSELVTSEVQDKKGSDQYSSHTHESATIKPHAIIPRTIASRLAQESVSYAPVSSTLSNSPPLTDHAPSTGLPHDYHIYGAPKAHCNKHRVETVQLLCDVNHMLAHLDPPPQSQSSTSSLSGPGCEANSQTEPMSQVSATYGNDLYQSFEPAEHPTSKPQPLDHPPVEPLVAHQLAPKTAALSPTEFTEPTASTIESGLWPAGMEPYPRPPQRFNPNDEINKICALTAYIFKVPIAMLTIYGDGHVYWRATVGIDAHGAPDWRDSFCPWGFVARHPTTIIVNDLLEDARFRDNEVIKQFGIRFYAGAPLVASNGHLIGTLCFAHPDPRMTDHFTSRILINFAELAVRELEKTLMLQALNQAASATFQKIYGQLFRGLDCVNTPVLFMTTESCPWTVMYANQVFLELAGMKCIDESAAVLGALFTCADGSPLDWQRFHKYADAENTFEVHNVRCGSQPHLYTLTFRPATSETLDDNAVPVGIPFAPSLLEPEEKCSFYFLLLKKEKTSPKQTMMPAVQVKQQDNGPLEGLQLGTLLGWGAQGRVYLGNWFGTNVAVKVIHSMPSRNQQGDPMEALLAKNLSHPNVVRTLKTARAPAQHSNVQRLPATYISYAGSTDSSHSELAEAHDPVGSVDMWILMELCDRGNLQDAVEKGLLRPDDCPPGSLQHMRCLVTTASEVAAGMQYLHSKQIVHGDLSALNVMLSSTGFGSKASRRFVAKVADFGMSRMLDVTSKICTHSYGAVTHMPPELILNGILGKATDVYGFGVLLWHMYTGIRPWAGLSHAQVVHVVAEERKSLIFPPDTPEPLAALARRCMSAEPENRPEFEEICRELQQLSIGLGVDDVLATGEKTHAVDSIVGKSEAAEASTLAPLPYNEFLQSL